MVLPNIKSAPPAIPFDTLVTGLPPATPTAALAVSSLAEEASVNHQESGSGFLKGGERDLRVTQGGEIGRGEVKDGKYILEVKYM